MNKIAHLFIGGTRWKIIAVEEFQTTIEILFRPPILPNASKSKKVKISPKVFIFEISQDKMKYIDIYYNRRYDLVDFRDERKGG